MDERIREIVEKHTSQWKPIPRDPARIEMITNALRELWQLSPDLRLGQLLLNLVDRDTDAYYVEDDVWLESIQEAIKQWRSEV